MNQAFEPGRGKPLPFDQQMEVEDVLDAAAEWQAGRLPTTEAAKIGGISTPGYTRFKAITTTPVTDPRWSALHALVSHLDDLSGGKMTRQGRFNRFEFDQARRATDDQLRRGLIWTGVK